MNDKQKLALKELAHARELLLENCGWVINGRPYAEYTYTDNGRRVKK